MKENEKRLLVVVAHPDDESIIGGTIARCTSQGARVALVTATRGEAGTIFDPTAATPESLPQVREEELRCACQVLGIQQWEILPCHDGAVRECTEQALEPIVHAIRRERPQVVLTFEPAGIYGHPDHMAVSRLATEAWRAAGDPSAFPQHRAQGLAPHQPARLFYFGMPQSLVELWSQYADLTVDLNGESLHFRGIPDEQITLALDISPFAERKEQAWGCHRSQRNPDAPRSAMPAELERRFQAMEYFILAGGVPLDPQRDGADLFAGL